MVQESIHQKELLESAHAIAEEKSIQLQEIEAEKNRPKRKYVKKTPEEREALKNRVKRSYTKKTENLQIESI